MFHVKQIIEDPEEKVIQLPNPVFDYWDRGWGEEENPG